MEKRRGKSGDCEGISYFFFLLPFSCLIGETGEGGRESENDDVVHCYRGKER